MSSHWIGDIQSVVIEIDLSVDSINRANKSFITESILDLTKNVAPIDINLPIYNAVWSSNIPMNIIGKSKVGLLPHDFTFDQLYNRIWFEPRLIDHGFITEQVDYNIEIWNAYRDLTKSVTNIAVAPSPQDGTLLSLGGNPVTLPFSGSEDISPDTVKIYVVSILKAGPPNQDTTYDYVIDALNFAIQILGERTLPFSFKPNWNSNVELALRYNTIISRTKWLNEQRRSLIPIPDRKESFTVLEENKMIQRLHNNMIEGHGRIFDVPIFSEPMHLTADLITGASNFFTVEDLDYLWNLQNYTTHIFIHDLINDRFAVKEISSIDVANDQIFLTVNMGNTYKKDETIIYPVMSAIIGSFSIDNVTDTLGEAKIVFDEIKLKT